MSGSVWDGKKHSTTNWLESKSGKNTFFAFERPRPHKASTHTATAMVIFLWEIRCEMARRTNRCMPVFMVSLASWRFARAIWRGVVGISLRGDIHDFAHIGTWTRAMTQLDRRLTHITVKRSLAYSDTVPGIRYTHMNVAAAMMVAPRSGMAVCRPIL